MRDGTRYKITLEKRHMVGGGESFEIRIKGRVFNGNSLDFLVSKVKAHIIAKKLKPTKE